MFTSIQYGKFSANVNQNS
uniref:Uncharacterized protein n=1 Tax=Arundo donax TaxID=35708 RepID=A0A0A9BX40_ARUDO